MSRWPRIWFVVRPMLAVGPIFLFGCGAFANRDTQTHQGASLNIRNQSDITICGVTVTPEQGGPAQSCLTDQDRILPGTTHSCPTAPGYCNLRIEDCDGRALFARQHFRIRGEQVFRFRTVEVQRLYRSGARRFASTPNPTPMGSPTRHASHPIALNTSVQASSF